ncbi:hypothetical protein HYY27_09855 [bacterium]|nr:hypothetical protein [bacterium]
MIGDLEKTLTTEENVMARETEAKRGAAKGKGAQSKDQPEIPCIVCGSENWCDCEWDHFYRESVEEKAEETVTSPS